MTEEQEKLIGREFRHFKGGHYRIEGFARGSETLEEMVVYRGLRIRRGYRPVRRAGIGATDRVRRAHRSWDRRPQAHCEIELKEKP